MEVPVAEGVGEAGPRLVEPVAGLELDELRLAQVDFRETGVELRLELSLGEGGDAVQEELPVGDRLFRDPDDGPGLEDPEVGRVDVPEDSGPGGRRVGLGGKGAVAGAGGQIVGPPEIGEELAADEAVRLAAVKARRAQPSRRELSVVVVHADGGGVERDLGVKAGSGLPGLLPGG